MMRCLRLRSPHSTSGFRFHFSGFQHFRFSILSKSSKQHKIKKTEETYMNNFRERKEFSNLFDEITEIFGTDDLIFSKNSSGFPAFVSKSNLIDQCTCTEPVCENTSEKEEESLPSLEEAQIVNKDVSPIVHKFTEIIRGEFGVGSIEEQLEILDIEFDIEIVDKVLKRCFKVPHLALRFFNWVKTRNGFCHTNQTYNTMMYIAGEMKEFGVVEELLEEMERNLCKKDVKTWTIIISRLGRAKMIGQALLMFEKMRKSGIAPDLAAYKGILGSLSNCGKAEIAMEFYMEMRSKEMELDLNSYKLLLKCLAHSGNLNAVQLVVDDMIQTSHIPEQFAYACLVKSFCIAGRIREALEVIRDLKNKNVAIDPEILETLVKGLCKADRISDALEIVEIMKKKNAVGVKIYEMIVDGYLRRDDISKAFEVFRNIKDSGHTPTLFTYTELLQKLFGLREFQKGYDLYDEMLEKGLKLDSVAVDAMVAGLVQQNRVSEAWTMFRGMEENGIHQTRKSYTLFIKELCKISRIDEIFNVLEEAQSSEVVIGDEVFDWVKAYLEKRGKNMDVENVVQMQRTYKSFLEGGKIFSLKTSIKPKPGPDLSFNDKKPKILDSHLVEATPKSFTDYDLHEICKILSSSLSWRSKEKALEKSTVQFTPELVVEVLRNCSLHGGAALQFFSWVGQRCGFSHKMETYNMAIKIAGRGKDFKYMRRLFFDMKRKGCLITSDTWTIMIMQYGRIGLTEIALGIFKEMKSCGCKPNKSTYKSLIISLCGKKGGKVDEAVMLFQEMIRAGFIQDKETIETYLARLCQVGNFPDARKCTESLLKVGFTLPLAKSMYIRALCRAGRLEEALLEINEVDEGQNGQILKYTYGSLVHALLQKGRLEDALAKMNSMKQIGIHPTVHVYTSLIVYSCKEKMIDKALEIFEKMKVEDGCGPTIVTYSALIRGYMDVGKVDEAWSLFCTMKRDGPMPDFKTYSMFISCLCNGGKSEKALQLISDMLDVGIVPSTVNFRNVSFGLNREGKQKLAKSVLRQKWDLQYRRKFLAD